MASPGRRHGLPWRCASSLAYRLFASCSRARWAGRADADRAGPDVAAPPSSSGLPPGQKPCARATLIIMRAGRPPFPRPTSALAAVASLAIAGALLCPSQVKADLDNQLFTSPEHRIKLTVPKGWRASELASYPGIVLWMLRSQPEARIVVGAEELRQELVCSWPAECRALSKPLAERYACALQAQLERQNILVGQIQAGPKENVAAGLPSVWFEFTDGKRYVRQAVAANERRVVSFALSTGSIADRGTHARAFDQALRSLQELSEAEARAAAPSSPSTDGGAAPPPAQPGVSPPSSPSSAAPAPSPATPPAGAAAASEPTERTKISAPLFNPNERCPGDPAPTAARQPSNPVAPATPTPSSTPAPSPSPSASSPSTTGATSNAAP